MGVLTERVLVLGVSIREPLISGKLPLGCESPFVENFHPVVSELLFPWSSKNGNNIYIGPK